MSANLFTNAAPKIAIKRKRTPVWPFATRATLEQAISGLIANGSVRELEPPDEWRIHPSTEARGNGFQHERFVRGIDDNLDWITVKLRQHAQDPARTSARSGFEGNEVSGLNTNLAELLRLVVRGGRPARVTPTRETPSERENCEIRNGLPKPAAKPQQAYCGEPSSPSAD